MTYPYHDPQLGGLLPKFITKPLKSVVGWVAGKGNTPGTPETRKYGYDRQAVANAAVEQIKAAQLQAPVAITPSAQTQVLLIGGAGLAALLLLGGKKKGRRR